mgnify:CR=1 FL=1
MGIVKSPLRHAPKNDPAHSSLSEEDHNKVHANTTSDFQTVEEENRFRNFVIKSLETLRLTQQIQLGI